MERIARGDLLGLCGSGLVIPNQCNAKRFAFLHELLHYCCLGRHTGAFDLRDRLEGCDCAIQRRGCTNRAVAAKHAGFDELPAGQANNDRNDARMRKIHLLDRLFGPINHRSLPKL